MEKFKAYLGLVAVVALAWLFLSTEPRSFSRDEVEVTPLDRTGIALIIQYRTPAYRLLARAQAYALRCPDGKNTQVGRGSSCELYELAPSMFDISDVAPDIIGYDPGFAKTLTAFHDAPSGSSADMAWSEVERRAVSTYPKLIPSYRASYQVAIYLFHVLFLGLLAILVIFRRSVGSGLLFPVTAVVALMRKAHRQV